MPVNKNALIRHKMIDKCLQNRSRRWTLEDLRNACSTALFEYEGVHEKVGKRTIQADIQFMRSSYPGYHAPIVVVDRKYYTYADKDYSITKIPVSKNDLERLSEISGILEQFKGFQHFTDLSILIQKLEDMVFAISQEKRQVIELEKNASLKGLEFIDFLYHAIRNKQVVNIGYQSFKAQRTSKIVFHPYVLKEYRNRWFILGRKGEKQPLMVLALDRIKDIENNTEELYVDDSAFDVDEYFKDTIGVTVNSNRPVNVHLLFDTIQAPYVLTKPLHHSQQLIKENERGVEIVIKVIPNFELEREILGFGEGVKVLAPAKLRAQIADRIRKANTLYLKD